MPDSPSLPAAVNLTKRQDRAMLAFLWAGGSRGFDDEACDGSVWDCGVRPWPTMDNLVTKGLVTIDGWYGPEEGNHYVLTDAGREYMTAVVARAAACDKSERQGEQEGTETRPSREGFGLHHPHPVQEQPGTGLLSERNAAAPEVTG